MEITNDEIVETFEAIRNSMIKKEEIERRKIKLKSGESYRRRSKSSSSSSNYSYVKRKSSKHEKRHPIEMRSNYDMNYFKLQFDNYLKNTAAFLSQNMGNMNPIQNLHNISPNIPHGINPLLNNSYSSHSANFSQLHNKTDKNTTQNTFSNVNLIPHMFPILHPYMHMIPFNPNFSQPFLPVGFDFSDEQKKIIEKININNFNFIKNSNSDSKGKNCPKENSSLSSSQSESSQLSEKGKYFNLKHLNEYKELESKMRRDQPQINLNDSKLMDQDLLIEKPQEILNMSSCSSDNNNAFSTDKNLEENIEVINNSKIEQDSLKIQSSRSISSKISNSNRDYSSNSKEDHFSSTSRRESKKYSGYKRRRSNSSRDSYDRPNSMSSSLSREKYNSKFRNEIRRPYHKSSYRNYHKYQTYNRYTYKIMNQNDYKEYKRNRQFINKSFSNKYGNNYPRQDRKSKYSDRDFRYHYDFSPCYSKDGYKSFSREKDRYINNDSPRNFVKTNSKEIPQDIENQKLEKKDSGNTIASDNYKEIIFSSGDLKRDFNRRKVSHFSDNPNANTSIKSEIIKDTKSKISNFSETPIINPKEDIDQNKEETNRSFYSNPKNRTFSRNNNVFMNNNKNNNNNFSSRNESNHGENSYHNKSTTDLKEKANTEIKGDIKTSLLVSTSDSKLIANEKKSNNEEIKTQENEIKSDNNILENQNSSVTNYITKACTPSIIPSQINQIPDKIEINNSNLEKNVINTNRIIIKNNEIQIPTTSNGKFNNSVNTFEQTNNNNKIIDLGEKKTTSFNISYNNSLNSNFVNPPLINLNPTKGNINTTLEKSNINTIINQSTSQRIIFNNNSQVKLITQRVEDSISPKRKISADLSSMIQKDNNFKIINVLGKKKIILNKERKNPDIKLKK